MEKIHKIAMIVIVMIMALANTSCISYSGVAMDMDGNSVPVHYMGSGCHRSGVMTYGGDLYPGKIMLQNLVIKTGLVTKLYDASGKLIKSYDLRIYDQNIKDVYWAKNLRGEDVEVTITVRGPNHDNNVLITDGKNSDYFYLRR